jgi:hypothetical protein
MNVNISVNEQPEWFHWVEGTKLVLGATTLTLHDILLSCKCFSYLFLPLFISEGPPTFGMTPDSVTIDYHISVNSRARKVFLYWSVRPNKIDRWVP